MTQSDVDVYDLAGPLQYEGKRRRSWRFFDKRIR